MNVSAKKHATLAAILLSLATLTACASEPEEDPLEGYNRAMHSFNTTVDKAVFRPVAQGYRYIAPQPVRDRIGNFSDNLGEPVNMINAFLQGDPEQGLTSFWRFIINSTIGLGGIHDVASTAGLKARPEDFGQTLAVWGVGSGPYVVLPFFGPSNVRDSFGMVADWYTDPFTYYLEQDDRIWLAVSRVVVVRERLLDPIDDIYDTSLDDYVTFRSIYDQRRNAQIENRFHDFDKSMAAQEAQAKAEGK